MPDRTSLGILTAAYLALLWLASSIARGKGLVLFAAGLAALAFALLRVRRGQRGLLYRLFLIVALAAATVAGLELILRAAPGVLKGRLANFTYSGYHGERDGIYTHDAELGKALRPNLRRLMYWNGHWWHHEANADGYRGPAPASADAVFVGDSMIYGHGVEATDTVPGQFTAVTGLPAANLGMQGTSLLQGLVLLERKGLRLRPRWVFACAHPNDPTDPFELYGVDELERFVATPGYRPQVLELHRSPRSRTVFDFWQRHVALPLRGGRLVLALIGRGGRDFALSAPSPEEDRPFVPGPDYRESAFEPEGANASAQVRLGWKVQRRALAEMQRLARQAGAQLVLFDIGYPYAFSRANAGIARELGIAYSAAGRAVLDAALAGEEMYLRRDGHWSPRGSRRVAVELARFVGAAPVQARH